MKKIDLKDKKFGRLIVQNEVGRDKTGRILWKCKCDCGNIRNIRGTDLHKGRQKSCGCLRTEKTIENSTIHNMSKTPTYRTWSNMVQRCNNHKNNSYYNYGGRGIKVCEKWLNFIGFFEDMGLRPDGLTIERRDNELGYSKTNCYWADRTAQARNQRLKKTNKTGVSGVSWRSKEQRYHVSIGRNKKSIYFGGFPTLETATEARKQAELKYWK